MFQSYFLNQSMIFILNRGELICLTCKKLLCYKCAFIGGHKDHVCKEISPAKESLLKRIDQITGMNARKAQKLVDVGNGFYLDRTISTPGDVASVIIS